MVTFKLGGQSVDTLDSVRYKAVLAYVDRAAPEAGELPQLRALGEGGEIDSAKLIEELDGLARRGVPDDVAMMLGNIRNDALRELRRQGKLGATE